MTTVVDSNHSTPSSRSVERRIGTSDLRVFPLAMSGNVFGWSADAAATEAILDAYAEAGGNFLDTADSYADGRSEALIGEWMRGRRNRADIVVATKVGKSVDNPGLSAKAITNAVHDSLRRLQTENIDLLYLHIDDESVPFEETLYAVDELIRAGKVRYFGGSDHTGNRLIEARIASAQMGLAPMIAVQNHYNLVHRREFEGDLARVADRQRLGVMPRFALASGFLTGKYRSRADIARSERAEGPGRYLNRRGVRVLNTLDRVASAHGTSIGTIALAWLLTKPHVVAPVVSARESGQVADLTAAARVQLTRAQVSELDRVSA